MNTVSGVELETMSDPIRVALREFSDRSNGAVQFNVDAAAQLQLTPDKPNSARSATDVLHLDEIAGTLYVIAFDIEDGTGDENTFKLVDQMGGGMYPLEPKVVPRSKAGYHSEAHLALASFFANSDEDPILFANNLDLVGLRNGILSQMGTLGQSGYDFARASFRKIDAEPTATYTTGYSSETGERFGDPHAVYNAKPHFIQVAGFLAISDEIAGRHAAALARLGAVEPNLNF